MRTWNKSPNDADAGIVRENGSAYLKNFLMQMNLKVLTGIMKHPVRM